MNSASILFSLVFVAAINVARTQYVDEFLFLYQLGKLKSTLTVVLIESPELAVDQGYHLARVVYSYHGGSYVYVESFRNMVIECCLYFQFNTQDPVQKQVYDGCTVILGSQFNVNLEERRRVNVPNFLEALGLVLQGYGFPIPNNDVDSGILTQFILEHGAQYNMHDVTWVNVLEACWTTQTYLRTRSHFTPRELRLKIATDYILLRYRNWLARQPGPPSG